MDNDTESELRASEEVEDSVEIFDGEPDFTREEREAMPQDDEEDV